MRFKELTRTPESYFALACLVLSALALAFIGALVAEPKVLFGRSLTAIPPSLFPTLVLAALAILSLVLVIALAGNAPDEQTQHGVPGWRRGVAFFGMMTFYALAMTPFGFLIASAISMAAMAWLTGNRSVWQIAVLSIAAPALLYLAATRLLAVSLPELNAIELFYARMIPR